MQKVEVDSEILGHLMNAAKVCGPTHPHVYLSAYNDEEVTVTATDGKRMVRFHSYATGEVPQEGVCLDAQDILTGFGDLGEGEDIEIMFFDEYVALHRGEDSCRLRCKSGVDYPKWSRLEPRDERYLEVHIEASALVEVLKSALEVEGEFMRLEFHEDKVTVRAGAIPEGALKPEAFVESVSCQPGERNPWTYVHIGMGKELLQDTLERMACPEKVSLKVWDTLTPVVLTDHALVGAVALIQPVSASW